MGPIVQQVHTWLYSWMTSGNVEDNEEYEISKYLLEKFICSQTVLDVVGEHWFLVYKVIKFLHGYVYTWETLYLHYLRNDVLHLDVSHLSAHQRSEKARVNFKVNSNFAAFGLNSNSANLGLL
jgi:hypothetical protein